jgi:hypothetical protein
MWKQVQSMIVKRMKRMRAARMAIHGGRLHQGNTSARENMAIPDMALPVVQVRNQTGLAPATMNRVMEDSSSAVSDTPRLRSLVRLQGDEARKMAERVQSRRLQRLRALNVSVNSGRVFVFMGSDKRVRPQRLSDGDKDKVRLGPSSINFV